ncbi:SET domain-containing protein 5, partial [Durusdinium trenchii]
VCSAWTVASDARRVRLGELSAMMYRARAPERLVRIARKLLRLYKDRIFLENNLVNKQSYRKEACKFGYEVLIRRLLPFPSFFQFFMAVSQKLESKQFTR